MVRVIDELIYGVAHLGEQWFYRLLSFGKRSFFGSILLFPLAIISYFYRAVIAVIVYIKKQQQWTPTKYTICVGNITTGGTGKTPLISMLIQESGIESQTLYISRGYGTKRKNRPHFTQRITLHDATYDIVGDEALLILQKFPLLQACIASTGKKAAIQYHARKSGLSSISTIIVDDALQHDEIAFHLRIATVNALEPFGFGWLLPRGMLREPAKKLRYVDYIVVTQCSSIVVARQLAHELTRKYCRPVICMESVIEQLYDSSGNSRQIDFSKATPLLVTAVANARRVAHLLEKTYRDQNGNSACTIASHLELPDHATIETTALMLWLERWKESKKETAENRQPLIFTTEKDRVKRSTWNDLPYPVIFIKMGFKVIYGYDSWKECLSRIKERK